MIKFNSSPEPTIGVEIELQLVDKNNLNLNNISSKALLEVNKEFSDNIKCELIESMIEINNNLSEHKEVIHVLESSGFVRLEGSEYINDAYLETCNLNCFFVRKHKLCYPLLLIS